MGELHVEVTLERLRREYGLKVKMGKVRVAYRESVASEAEHQVRVLRWKASFSSLDGGLVGMFPSVHTIERLETSDTWRQWV
jgi:translation elongation factor EF-G